MGAGGIGAASVPVAEAGAGAALPLQPHEASQPQLFSQPQLEQPQLFSQPQDFSQQLLQQ
ncbi:MAG TPA: hypothetical protein VGJ04_02510 [Pirellulales bacterium]